MAPKVEPEEDVPPPSNEEVPFRSDKRSREPETEADLYTLRVFFDQEEGMYRAGFEEFPELLVTEPTRKDAVYEAEDKLYSHLAALRQSGQPVPQPIRNREYPSKLEVSISQNLYRKLEARRYQERVSLEQMVTEILTSAMERKSDAQPNNSGQGRGDRGRGAPASNKGQRSQGGGRGNRRNYNETMDNRENFMEYVRNLEKGGGPGNYRKR
jgi:predicted RNase H-like HicB family nuclease